MNTNAILKKEGIEIISQLNTEQVSKIATIVAHKICEAFLEHSLNVTNVVDCLADLDMFFAKMPKDSAMAKYFSQSHAIYFSDELDLENLDTLVIHECLHAIQEIKNSRGKLVKLGLFDFINNQGQGINEAAVQLMSSVVTSTKIDTVKYYNMTFDTLSPLFYPIETALINQMIYFTGSYPLFHSTIYSNFTFKNMFIAKTSEKVYREIESNFDALIHSEGLLSSYCYELTENQNPKKQKRIQEKIDSLKSTILNLTLATQNLIIENCFQHEFELIKDAHSLQAFQKKLYDFHKILITTESYHFYQQFYCHMMNQLEEKRELIKTYGTLHYLNHLETKILDLEHEYFGFQFFHRLFEKLKFLLEDVVKDKNHRKQ